MRRVNPPFYRTIYSFLRPKVYRSDGWFFSDFRKKLYISEAAEWKHAYLPMSMKGLTVLDVGAGEGETARFFLEHGARKVICIEPDREAFKILCVNAKNRPIECYCKPFSLSDLDRSFDFMKMDIEGFEEELLKLPGTVDKPCIIEVHGLQLVEKFYRKGYFQVPGKTFQERHGWICYMY